MADLLDHVDGLAMAFTMAAEKTVRPGGSQDPRVDGTKLGDDCRARIPSRVARFGGAWQTPEAWRGMTSAGAVDLPSEVVGLVP